MSTILMLCFIVYAAFSWVQIKKIAKHDGVLFPFCQLRRDIMKFRFDEIMQPSMTLSRDERESLRRLSSALDNVIHNYSRHKKMMFDLRKMIKAIREYRHILKQIPAIDMTNNTKIQEFHHRFAGLLARAFIAYTPLIRWERTLRLIANAYRAGKKEGAHRRAEQAQYIISNAEKARNDARRYGLIGDGAAA